MSKKESITIGRKVFTYYGETERATIDYRHTYADIFKAYTKPSSTKVAVWQDYYNYFKELSEDAVVRVLSRNVYMFSIIAEFTYNGSRYLAYIYPTHDDLFRVID